jgi:predicted dehydrogenase
MTSTSRATRIAVAGIGKMGLSHLAIVNAQPDLEVAAVCDASGMVRGVLEKYTGVVTYDDYDRMLREVELDAVLIATPSRTHASMVRTALERGLHVFCEKPFTLAVQDATELTALARSKGLVTQVGYHNRFVGPFAEVKRLLDAGAIGTVTHALGEAYGPVVLKPKGGTWRSRKEEGGGALYDYAAHPLNLLNWYFGGATSVGGTVLRPIFSRETDDEVHSTIHFAGGESANISVNWSDESHRKMTTRMTIWGTAGRIFADRQEIQVFLRDGAAVPEGYERGWNVRYGTELTGGVGFYLRGEEYSAQIEHFAERVREGRTDGVNGFESAAETDRVIAMLIADAATPAPTPASTPAATPMAGPRHAEVRRPRRRVRFPWGVPQPAVQLELREGS